MAEPARYLTVERAAAIVEVDPETIRRAIRAGRLACYRPGGGRLIRITPEQLDAYMESTLCPVRETTPPISDPDEASSKSSGTKADSVDGFRQARRTRSALDKPSRISRPSLSVVPSS
ncbi:MAG: helix-turn-helix domain-containing protein [Inquilinus sp.]|uniref:helix-turn-helix domain-containing protein n=1 Tax=Inquilinus sp. TaxID=1932117 RepID=UPI003F397302